MRFRQIIFGCTLILLSGCAVTPEQFYSQRSSLSAVTLCRTYQSAVQSSQWQLARDIETELGSRLGVQASQCSKVISDNEMAILGGVLIAAAVVAAASEGGGAAAPPVTSSQISDYDWDWDQFYNEYGVLVWRCRGIQTGQFAENSNCAYDAMTDHRWPTK
jgi:hypothetical protein